MTKVTIGDVAREAECSTATVSLVLNGLGRVAEKTRKRVLKAKEKLGYVPNPAGRNLRTQKTNTVGLLFYPSCARLFRNVFYAEVMEGLEEELSRAGYDLLLSGGDLAAADAPMPTFLKQRRVDAAVLLGAFPHATVERLVSAGVPLILLDNNHEDLPVDSITTDAFSASRVAVEHLYAQGHRRILFMAYDIEDYNIDARVHGFQAGLRAHGLPVEGAVERSFIAHEDGYRALRARMDGASAPTAILAVNDTLAAAMIARLREDRVRLPAELSVVGFDDDVFAQEITPRLTTIAIDKHGLGRAGAKVLIDRMLEPLRPVIKLRMPVRLVERDSVTKPTVDEKK